MQCQFVLIGPFSLVNLVKSGTRSKNRFCLQPFTHSENSRSSRARIFDGKRITVIIRTAHAWILTRDWPQHRKLRAGELKERIRCRSGELWIMGLKKTIFDSRFRSHTQRPANYRGYSWKNAVLSADSIAVQIAVISEFFLSTHTNKSIFKPRFENRFLNLTFSLVCERPYCLYGVRVWFSD